MSRFFFINLETYSSDELVHRMNKEIEYPDIYREEKIKFSDNYRNKPIKLNYLAHLLLSGYDPQIRFGNFVGDAIKGKDYLLLPNEVQKGVLLHRHIDNFTDTHPIVSECKQKLNPKYRLYKGVIIDVFFDHFLSKNWSKYSNEPIEFYLEKVENEFHTLKYLLPKEKMNYYEKFLSKSFLYHYDNFEGIAQTLRGLEFRIKNRVPLSESMEDLIKNYDYFEMQFDVFFEEINQSVNLFMSR